MRRLSAVCATLLLLAGCGGGGGGPAHTVTVEAGKTLTVKGKEYSFDPSRIVVEGGGALTIEFENAGSLAHNLKLRRGGRQIRGTPSLPAGSSRSVRGLLEPGGYEFLCTVGDHAQLGMKGTLEVK